MYQRSEFIKERFKAKTLTLLTKKKSKIQEKWKENTQPNKKKVRNQDLDNAIDQEKKQFLRSYFFSFINSHLR